LSSIWLELINFLLPFSVGFSAPRIHKSSQTNAALKGVREKESRQPSQSL